jgi:hypothetical protein
LNRENATALTRSTLTVNARRDARTSHGGADLRFGRFKERQRYIRPCETQIRARIIARISREHSKISAVQLIFHRDGITSLQIFKQHMHANRSSGVNRYSAKAHLKPINFYCTAPGANAVFIVGDFNDWNATAHPMEKQFDGTWFAQVQFNHGHHHYLFLIDGRPTLDPRAQGIGRNEMNEKVSLIAVS